MNLNPYFIYLKIGICVLALTGAAWGAWFVRDAIADKQTDKAVKEAIADAQAVLNTERSLRATYQTLAEGKLETLLQSISNIRVEHVTITKNITKEREINHEFYKTPLPLGGYEEWKRSRALLGASQGASSPR